MLGAKVCISSNRASAFGLSWVPTWYLTGCLNQKHCKFLKTVLPVHVEDVPIIVGQKMRLQLSSGKISCIGSTRRSQTTRHNPSASFSGYFTTVSVSQNIVPYVKITVESDELERTRKTGALTQP